MRYAIVIEKAESNFSAYVPDLPGCVATGATVEEPSRLLIHPRFASLSKPRRKSRRPLALDMPNS